MATAFTITKAAAAGAPVLLVHGLGSRAEDWANLMPQLKQAGFHVYAIDLLGYGRSARPANAAYSIPEEAQYVEDSLTSTVAEGEPCRLVHGRMGMHAGSPRYAGAHRAARVV